VRHPNSSDSSIKLNNRHYFTFAPQALGYALVIYEFSPGILRAEIYTDGDRSVTEFLELSKAIERFVKSGDTVAMEGFTHLIPFAAGHEIIRQKIENLTAIRLTPDLIYDQMIGAGCIKKIIFSWGGNPGVGSLHRFRDAYQNSWPHKIEIEEHTHAGLTNRYVAGASGIPFAVIRGYSGSDLVEHTENISQIQSPFGDEVLTAVAAINPDVTIIHAQQADKSGNVMMWGITGVAKEAVFAAKKVVVTVEEIVEEFSPKFNAIVIPNILIDAISLCPQGAWPSYASDYYERDNVQYIAWDEISKDRESFAQWLKNEIFNTDKSGKK
jgi:glutaconate CoA-transferase subunit A